MCTLKTEHSTYIQKMFAFILTIGSCEINSYCEIDLGSAEKANTNLIKSFTVRWKNKQEIIKLFVDKL